MRHLELSIGLTLLFLVAAFAVLAAREVHSLVVEPVPVCWTDAECVERFGCDETGLCDDGGMEI